MAKSPIFKLEINRGAISEKNNVPYSFSGNLDIKIDINNNPIKTNGALNLTGRYIQILKDLSIYAGSFFQIIMIIYPTSNSGRINILNNSASGGNFLTTWLSGGGLCCTVRHIYDSGASIYCNLNNWNYVVIENTKTTLRFFLNGNLSSSGSSSGMNFNTNGLRIGGSSFEGNSYSGYINAFNIYNEDILNGNYSNKNIQKVIGLRENKILYNNFKIE